jgi:hypothetical protein
MKELIGKLKTEFEKFEAEIKGKLPQKEVLAYEVKADEYKVSYNDISYIHERISSLRDLCYKVWGELDSHARDGHLPKLQTPEDFAKALKALGLDKNYEVKKRVIYASNGDVDQTLWELTEKQA